MEFWIEVGSVDYVSNSVGELLTVGEFRYGIFGKLKEVHENSALRIAMQ